MSTDTQNNQALPGQAPAGQGGAETPVVQEPRWPASLAVLATLVLYVTLPEKLTYGPAWLVPVLEFALLVPLLVVVPYRNKEELRWQRAAGIAIIAILTLANIASLVLLILSLLAGGKSSGRELILAAIQIWLTNVLIFALWYWELDRGGPGERPDPDDDQYPDFLFPQMVTPAMAPRNWTPLFLDYLYVSFTNATAFSPTDTLPLTRWAKVLMLVQSLASLLTVALVAARAVNILT